MIKHFSFIFVDTSKSFSIFETIRKLWLLSQDTRRPKFTTQTNKQSNATSTYDEAKRCFPFFQPILSIASIP